MNKKIVSLALSAAMAASAFAFIGCEGEGSAHKHTYKTSYVLAKCETDGYTLHTCTECGHKYADEFVDAYGHAYEYCVGLAMHNDQPALQADNGHDEHTFDFSELIGAPLSAITAQQSNLAKTYLSTLMNKAVEADPPQSDTVKFHFVAHHDCSYCDDGGVSAATIDVPMMSLVPIPAFTIDEATVQFEMVVTNPLPDDWHDDHGFGNWNLPSKLVKNSATVMTAPTPYQIDQDGKTLTISTKKLENVNVPEGVKKINQLVMSDAYEEIGANVFAEFSGLRRCDLPLGIKKIGANAFGAAVFDYIIIPNSVENIGRNAFGACSKTKCVFYAGTETEWSNISIDDGNDGLKKVKRYYYSEQKPTTKGNYWHFVDESPVVW